MDLFHLPARVCSGYTYVDMAVRNQNAAEIFECPADREIRDPLGLKELTGGHSTYDFYGNSYMMNWLLLSPINERTGFVNRRGVFRLSDVEIPYSNVVLAADCQWYYTVNNARWDAHFHNYDDKMNVLFLDGHVEFLQLIRKRHITGKYSFSPYEPDEDD